jgi:hypothetical protein
MNARVAGSSGNPGDCSTSWTIGGAVPHFSVVRLLRWSFVPRHFAHSPSIPREAAAHAQLR